MLFNALQFAMCLKFKENFTNPLTQVNLIDDDFKISLELSSFALVIKREVCGVLESLIRFEEWKAHDMLSLMLNTIYISLCIVPSFIGHEERTFEYCCRLW